MKDKHKDTPDLGPLQRDVLGFIWAHPGCCVRESVDDFTNKGRCYAYTTIKTVCESLHRRKLVTRRRVKNAYHYHPRQSRNHLLLDCIHELFRKFFNQPQPIAVSLLDTIESEDPEQLQLLIKELKERGYIQ